MIKDNYTDTTQWYDDHSEQYARAFSAVSYEAPIRNFLGHLPPSPAVLDAGCGAGRDARILAVNGAKVTGVDLSKGLLSIASRDNPEIEFLHADFRALPFPANSFDGIWSNASFVHFEHQYDAQTA